VIAKLEGHSALVESVSNPIVAHALLRAASPLLATLLAPRGSPLPPSSHKIVLARK